MARPLSKNTTMTVKVGLGSRKRCNIEWHDKRHECRRIPIRECWCVVSLKIHQ